MPAVLAAPAQMSHVTDVQWISMPNIRYHVGLDGVSLWLVLLSTFLTPIAVIISWNYIDKRQKEFYGFLMVLDALSGQPRLTLPDGTPCNNCAGAQRSTESPPGEPALLTGDGVLLDLDPNFSVNPNAQNRVLGRPYGQQSWRQMR